MPAFKISLSSPLKGALDSLRRHLPPLNFIVLHYAYFLATCLLAAIIFWGSSTPAQSISFTDALFLTVSAMTEAGLNTVNLSELNTFQQIILFLMIMLGGTILVSSAVIRVRIRAFEKRFTRIVEEEREKRNTYGRDRGLSFIRSFTRMRATSNSGARGGREPEVDGVVVRGRPVQESNNDAGTPSTPSNPGDHPPPEREQHSVVREESSANGTSSPENPESQDSTAETETRIDEKTDNQDQSDQVERFAAVEPPSSPRPYTIRFANADGSELRPRSRILSMSGVGARPYLLNHPHHSIKPETAQQASTLLGQDDRHGATSARHHPSGGFIGRNSQFHSLTPQERHKLGGVEYRALQSLEIIVSLYFILFQLFGAIGCAAWVAVNAADTALSNGLNPWWVGAFNAVSAFNNSGMSLLDANMVAFQTSDYILITMSLLILAGNTCYPIFLRLIIWTIWRILPNDDYFCDTKIALRFLLDHPRRCYTTLFPSYHTYFLVGAVVILNGIDWFAFEILNLGNPYVESLPSNTRVIDGLFQAFAVRSGGFYVVPISNINIALQVLYVLMMYISVYPVTMTIRNSNVYEERSLGIYAEPEDRQSIATDSTLAHAGQRSPGKPLKRTKSFADSIRNRLYTETGTQSRSYFIRQQLRSQLAHDLWWICLAVLLIMIIESSSFAADPVSYSVFNVLFEVVSAYGTVGISVGLPNVAYSFCGGWHILSKLILCAVMLRGRHRGLPVAIDRAVLLPGEHLARAEEEDARIRMERISSRLPEDRNV